MSEKSNSLFTESPNAEKSAPDPYAFRWLEAGPDNPFGIRVLDVRSFTRRMIATTKDPSVADRYTTLRASDGRDLITLSIADAHEVACDLHFPHNGAPLHGIVFKAQSMEVKWDIYIYDGVFYLARSWTGELVYKAVATVSSDAIRISSITCRKAESELAASNVFFLLGSHAMGRVLPHRIPRETAREEMKIALTSFSLFGNQACYATFDEITQLSLKA